MSIGFLVPDEQALIWRGPMLHSAVRQFLGDVIWGELDYLIIDLPPGHRGCRTLFNTVDSADGRSDCDNTTGCRAR